jgi:hypothetical protein
MELIRQTDDNSAPVAANNKVHFKASQQQQQQQQQQLRQTATSTAAGTISNVVESTKQCLDDDELANAEGVRSLTEYQYQVKTAAARRKKLRSSTSSSNANATVNLNATGTSSRRSVSSTTTRVGFSGNSMKRISSNTHAVSAVATVVASPQCKLHVYSGSVFDHRWLASLDSSITSCIQGTRY